MHVITPKKIGIALDVDGVMFDTNPECYERVCEAWHDFYGSDFPLSYGEFNSFRPEVAEAEDYFSFSRMMIENDHKLPDNAA